MPEQDFFFALEMSDEPSLDRMVGELTGVVLGQVGYAAAVKDDVAGALRSALANRVAAGHRRCTVRFVATDGQLQVVVAGDGAPEWRTSRPLPAP